MKTSKIIFKIGLNQISFILLDIAEAGLLTGTCQSVISHDLLVIGPSIVYHVTSIKSCNWLNMIEILHFTFRHYILLFYKL